MVELIDDKTAGLIGEAVIRFLHLKPIKDQPGTYSTTWGNKTKMGIGRSVHRMVMELKENQVVLDK